MFSYIQRCSLPQLSKCCGLTRCSTNGFHEKAKNKRFTAASLRCRQNLKYENFMWSFGTLRQNIAPKSMPHVQHHLFSSFNQSIHWFVASSLPLPSSNLGLPHSCNVVTFSNSWLLTSICLPNTAAAWSLLGFICFTFTTNLCLGFRLHLLTVQIDIWRRRLLFIFIIFTS